MNVLNFILNNKTYLLCIGVIIGAWSQYAMGLIDLHTAITTTEAALAGITIRHGISKGPSDKV